MLFIGNLHIPVWDFLILGYITDGGFPTLGLKREVQFQSFGDWARGHKVQKRRGRKAHAAETIGTVTSNLEDVPLRQCFKQHPPLSDRP